MSITALLSNYKRVGLFPTRIEDNSVISTDADLACLYSCSGTKNEDIETHNHVIDV